MKKGLIYFLPVVWLVVNSLFVFSSLDSSINTTAARCVKLKKIAAAHDENGSFIFKNPHHILVVTDGSIFLIDNGQVLKFDAEGNFSKVIVKTGEGPSEASHLYEIYNRNSDLIVNTGFMNKLMVFDFNGELKAEFKQLKRPQFMGNDLSVGSSTFRILGHRKNGDFIVLANFPPGKSKYSKGKHGGKTNVKEKPVILLSGKNEWLLPMFDIPLESITVKTQLRELPLAILSVVYASNERYIFFSNTERYEVKRYNISENKIDSTWKRKYNPVPMPEELKGKMSYGEVSISGSIKSGKTENYRAPEKDFLIDIKKIVTTGTDVWVMTSTMEREKGIMIDVINDGGEYADHFFLSPPEGMEVFEFYRENEISIYNDFLIIKQEDAEGNPIIVKYKMIDSDKV